jgi:hypothetical protein
VVPPLMADRDPAMLLLLTEETVDIGTVHLLM